MTVNMVCGSGLKAINLIYNEIKFGNIKCGIAGGVENMSMAPMLKNRYEEDIEIIDSILNDSLMDKFNNYHMGITAENIACKYNITREELDYYAYESQIKTIRAIKNNIFKNEITPIKTADGKMFSVDEFPRETDIEKLKELKPAFKENGIVTAGNSSGINDGGAFLLIGSKINNTRPMVEIIDFAEVGIEPEYMGMGPYYAIKKILSKNNFNLMDIDLYEINEAFASQCIAVINELVDYYKVDINAFKERLNVNGGAIALGHPVGASGARIVTSLIYEMKRRNAKYGVASLCIGGGMGIAILLKNVED